MPGSLSGSNFRPTRSRILRTTDAFVMKPTTRIRVGDLVSGERVKTRVAPRFHPVDQFGGYHPFFDKQRQNLRLKQFPKDGNVEDGNGDETPVGQKRSCGSENVQMGVPVQEIPGGLHRDDRCGQRRFPGDVTDERGDRLPCAPGKSWKKLAPVAECGAQCLRERKDQVAVGNGPDHLRTNELGPQDGALG